MVPLFLRPARPERRVSEGNSHSRRPIPATPCPLESVVNRDGDPLKRVRFPRRRLDPSTHPKFAQTRQEHGGGFFDRVVFPPHLDFPCYFPCYAAYRGIKFAPLRPRHDPASCSNFRQVRGLFDAVSDAGTTYIQTRKTLYLLAFRREQSETSRSVVVTGLCPRRARTMIGRFATKAKTRP